MGGPELRGLKRELEARAVSQRPLERLRPVTHNNRDCCRRQRPGGTEHVLDHRQTGNRVKDLWEGRLHPGPLAGGKNDHVSVRHYWSYDRLLEALNNCVNIFGRPTMLLGQR